MARHKKVLLNAAGSGEWGFCRRDIILITASCIGTPPPLPHPPPHTHTHTYTHHHHQQQQHTQHTTMVVGEWGSCQSDDTKLYNRQLIYQVPFCKTEAALFIKQLFWVSEQTRVRTCYSARKHEEERKRQEMQPSQLPALSILLVKGGQWTKAKRWYLWKIGSCNVHTLMNSTGSDRQERRKALLGWELGWHNIDTCNSEQVYLKRKDR